MDRQEQARRQGEELNAAAGGDGPKRPAPATTPREVIEARVRASLGLRSGGPESSSEIFAPDVVAEVAGPAMLRPFCGRYVGRDAVLAAMRNVQINFERIEENILDMVIEGDVCILWRAPVLRNRGTGAALQFHSFDRYVFRDGLVVDFFQLVDTASVARLAGALDTLADWGRDREPDPDPGEEPDASHQPS